MLLVAWLRRFHRPRATPVRRAPSALRLRVTRLEQRRVLNASALVPFGDPTSHAEANHDAGSVQRDDLGGVTIDAGRFADDGSDDFFHVVRNDERIVVSLNGSTLFSGLTDDVTRLTIRGSSDADHLQVDLGESGQSMPALSFDGHDSAAIDTLVVQGSSSAVEHTLLGEGDGRVAADGSSIDYDGVEVLRDAVSTATRELNLDSVDSMRLAAGDDVLTLSGGGHSVLFERADQLTFDLDGNRENQFEIVGLDSSHDDSGDVAIVGDDADRIRFTGSADLGRSDLAVDAGTIDVMGSIHSDGGTLQLTASSQLTVATDGVLDSDGGFVELNAGDHGTLTISGRIDVSDDDGVGGEARLLGQNVHLTEAAAVDAGGRLGGGTILVGGDYQGANHAVLNALRTSIDHGATLSADALDTGDGGRIIVWADEVTRFAGAIFATGGRFGGDGGFAEVSGKGSLAFLGTVDLSADYGHGGTLLLDPKTITVVAADPDLNGDDTTGDDLENPGDLGSEDAQGAETDSIITADAIEAILAGGQSLVLVARDRIDIDAAITVTEDVAGLTLVADVVSIDAAIGIAGDIEIRADNIHIQATIDTPGDIVLTTDSTDVKIQLGGEDVAGSDDTAATLGISNEELALLDAATLHVGSETVDTITAAASETILAGGQSLVLVASNRIDIDSAISMTEAAADLALVADVVSVDAAIGIAGDVEIRADNIHIQATIDTPGDIVLTTDGTIQLADTAELHAGTTVTITKGTLTGTGTVNGHLVIASGASLSPGSSPGQLTVNGDLTLSAGSTSIFEIDDDLSTVPVAGTDYDQVVVTGNTTIEGGALLSLVKTGSTAISPGDAYTLIDTGGTLTGTFQGHPDASLLTDFGGAGIDADVRYLAGDFTVQVVGPLVFDAPDGAGPNNLRLVVTDGYFEFYVNGELESSGLLALLDSITVTGSDGVDDSLTVDFSGDAFGVDITFNGGEGGNDSLTLDGDSFTTITHTFANANDGRIDLVDNEEGIDETIFYTGLEPIDDNLEAANRVFTFSDESETITVTDADTTTTGLLTIDSTHGESVTFVNPTASMTINAGGGDDVIAINSIDSAYHTGLTIDGGAGNDEVNLATALALGSATSAGNLNVTAEDITMAANVVIDSSLAGGNVTLDGAVALLASVSINTDGTVDDGAIVFTSSLNSDPANDFALTITAGAGNVDFQGAVGEAGPLATLTIVSAGDVTFDSTVSVDGNLTQTTGTGTTTLNGGSIEGTLSLETGAVTFAAGTTDVDGSATIIAATAIAGGTADGSADLMATSITLSTTGATGNVGVAGTPLEIANAVVVNVSTAAGNGDVFLTAIGDLNLELINAGTGDVTLVATGAIVDVLAGDGEGNENILAASASLTAATGIGSTEAIDISVSTLSAVNTTSGDLRIDAQSNVSTTLLAQQRATPGDPIPDGVIFVTAVGQLTVEGTGVLTEGPGDITLTAGTDLIIDAAPVTAGSHLTLTASDNIEINAVATAGNSTVAVGTLRIDAGGSVDMNASGSGVADGDVTVLAGTGSVSLGGSLQAGASNVIRIVAGQNVTQSSSGGITGGALGVIAGDGISLLGDSNDVDDFAGTSTSGSLAFADTDGFVLGSVAASDSDFSETVGAIAIDGDVSLYGGSGPLVLDADVTTSVSGTVRLSGSSIQQVSGTVSAAELGAIATGNVAAGEITLTSSTNNVAVLAASANGDVTYHDVDGFAVGSVSSAAGFEGVAGVAGHDVTLHAATGSVTLANDVSADDATGVIRISAEDGSVSQDTGTTVKGAALGVRAGVGGITLANSDNDVTFFAAASEGSISYRDETGFTVGTVDDGDFDDLFVETTGAQSTTGNVTLHAGNGTLTLDADVSTTATGTVRLTSGGGISQSGGAITATDLAVQAAGEVSLLSAGNSVDTFAAVNGGANAGVAYRDANSLTIGTVGGDPDSSGPVIVGIETINGDVLLVTNRGGAASDGNLSIHDAIDAGGGTVRIDADGTVSQMFDAAITANALGVRATGGVTLLSDANDVAIFAARTTGDDILLRDQGKLSIGTVTAVPSQFDETAGVATDGGDLLLEVGIANPSDNVVLSIDANIAAGAGVIRISVDGSITQTATITGSSLGIHTLDGEIDLLAANDVDIFAATSEGGAIRFADVDDLTIGTVSGLISNEESLFSTTVGVDSETGDVAVVAGSLTIAETISSLGGTILLQADSMAIQADVDATNTAIVQITPRTDGQVITLGEDGGLSLDETEINFITAELLAIGGIDVAVADGASPASAGRITIAGALSLVTPPSETPQITHLSFLTGADVFGTSTGSIGVNGAIVFDVETGVTGNGGSDGTFLEVSASGFAGRVNGTGEFRVSSDGDTTVGLPVALDPIAIAGDSTGFDGITTTNGTIALEADGGNLTVVADLAVQGANADIILQAIGLPAVEPTNDVTLNANITSERSVLILADRDIVQASDAHFVSAPGVRLEADQNIGSAAAPIDLRAGTVSAVASFGSVFLNEDEAGGGLTIGAVGGVTGVGASGEVVITTEAGDLAVTAPVSAGGSVELMSAAGMSSTSAGTIDGSIVELTAANAVLLDGAVNSDGITTIHSTASRVELAAANVGGQLDVDADGGGIRVDGVVVVTGTISFDAAARIAVAAGGSLSGGNTIDLNAGGTIFLGGPVAATTALTADSADGNIVVASPATAGGMIDLNALAGNVSASAAVTAGGMLDIDAAGNLTVTPAGSLSGNVVDLLAGGPISLAGALHSSSDVSAVSTDGRIAISAVAHAAGNFIADAQGGLIFVSAAVVSGGVLDFQAASTLTTTAGGSLMAHEIKLKSNGQATLGGSVVTGSTASIVSTNSGVALNGPVSAGNMIQVEAGGAGVSVAAKVKSGGQITVDAAGSITVTNAGSMAGTGIVLAAGGNISLGGAVASGGNVSATSANGGIALAAPLNAGGNLVAVANAGHVSVSGPVLALGAIDVTAAATIGVGSTGSMTAAAIELKAGTGATLAGTITSGSNLLVTTSGGSIGVSSRLAAGNSLALAAPHGGINVNAAGQLLSRSIDVVAGGQAILAGRTAAVTDIVVTSGSHTVIAGRMTAGNAVLVDSGGRLDIAAPLETGGLARLQSQAMMNVTSGGSIGARTVQMLGGGSVLIGGRVNAALDAAVLAAGGSVTVGAPVTAGQNIAMLAGGGNMLLSHNVQAGRGVVLESPNGSVLQPSTAWTVAGATAVFVAGGSVGRSGEAIDLAVGQVAATAVGGGAWLNQDASGGTLTVAILGTERGVRSSQPVGVSTENGDIVLAAPVMGSTIDLVANRVAGSADHGHVVFNRGYAETPTGRIVASPPQNIPVDAAGNPITRFELASPFVVSFDVIAGNVADTVDGRLGDRGVTVTVDFVQPRIFDPTQSRFQSILDTTGALVASQFSTFSFQYSELFLQERLILGGAREQLFNILITASQDNSISIAEQLAGVTIVDPTEQTFRFGDVSTSPTEQSLSVPLGIVSPVLAGIDAPEIVEPEEPVTPTEPTPYVAPVPTLPVAVVAAESSGASAGASSADRPRLFLVWERPGESGEPATIEIDLIWFARDYQRQLIGYLKEGRYWFELAEPGSPARQLGDSFYVRNGLVIDDPAEAVPDSGQNATPEPSAGDTDVPATSPPLPEAGSDQRVDQGVDQNAGDRASTGEQAAAAAVFGGLLSHRWRRRLTAAHAEDRQTAPLGKSARVSRRLRKAAQADRNDDRFSGSRAIWCE